MAVSQTNRFAIYKWSSGADPLTRPAASTAYQGFFHFSATNVLSYCDGSAWYDLGNPANTSGEIGIIDGTASAGSSDAVSRADHKHAIAPNTITQAMLAPGVIDTTELADLSITTSKIANDQVTYAKMQNAGSNVVLGNAGSAGDLEEIAAATNTVLRRVAGDLGFGKIETAHITDGAVTDVKITSTKFADMSGSDDSGRIQAEKLACLRMRRLIRLLAICGLIRREHS
jgi:hypothetical protein